MSQIPEKCLRQMQRDLVSGMEIKGQFPDYWLDQECAKEAAKRVIIAYVDCDSSRIKEFLTATIHMSNQITSQWVKDEIEPFLEEAITAGETLIKAGRHMSFDNDVFRDAAITAAVARSKVEKQMYYELSRPENVPLNKKIADVATKSLVGFFNPKCFWPTMAFIIPVIISFSARTDEDFRAFAIGMSLAFACAIAGLFSLKEKCNYWKNSWELCSGFLKEERKKNEK